MSFFMFLILHEASCKRRRNPEKWLDLGTYIPF